jgi:hypothetical protein
MIKHTFSAKSGSICGHEEMASFTYGSKSVSRSDRLYVANTLCVTCSTKVRGLVTPEAKGFFKLPLPTLLGTSRSISYANVLRIKALRAIGPVMAKLDKSDEPYAKVALSVYKMLFKITLASFWIENIEARFDGSWMAFEIAALMRKVPTASVRASSSSAHEYWRITDPSVIATAAETLEALAVGVSQPPQATTTSPDAVVA